MASNEAKRNRFDLEDLEDAEDAGRYIKCEAERIMETAPDTVTTIEVDVTEVSHRERY